MAVQKNQYQWLVHRSNQDLVLCGRIDDKDHKRSREGVKGSIILHLLL